MKQFIAISYQQESSKKKGDQHTVLKDESLLAIKT